MVAPSNKRFLLESDKGIANGLATLDGAGKIPDGQLKLGAANGVATLDGTSKLPDAQIPARLSAAQLAAGFIAKGAIFINVKDFGAKGDSSTDDTAAIQAAIDAAATRTTGGQLYGGIVMFPEGVYKTGPLKLRSRTFLYAPGKDMGQGSRESPVRLIGVNIPANGFLFTTDEVQLRQCALIGFSAYGGGATSTTGFFSVADAEDTILSNLFIDNWGREAVIMGGQNNRISFSFFQGLMNKTILTEATGSFRLTGVDHQVTSCELTGTNPAAVSSTNLYAAGAYFNIIESVISDTIFQVGDVGLNLAGGSRYRFTGCRFDGNLGHGLYITSGTDATFAGCAWARNSRTAAGTYDHINVPSTGGSRMTFTSPLMNTGDTAVRYCINDQKNSSGFHNLYIAPQGDPGTTGLASVSTGANPSVVILESELAGQLPVNSASAAAVNVNTTALTARPVHIIRTLTANAAVTFTAGATGKAYSSVLELRQDATGGRVITWPTSALVRFPGGVAPVLSTAANAVDVFRAHWNGEFWLITTQAMDVRQKP